jgi:hypothetical protein
MVDFEMTVNLADPQDVRSRMPDIQRLLAAARQQLAAVEAQVELLERIVGERRPAGQASSTAASGKRARTKTRKARAHGAPNAAPAQERVIHGLEVAGRAMGPAELYRFMEARDLPRPNTLERMGSVLWAAAQAGRVVSKDGKYEPKGGFPTAELPDLDDDGLLMRATDAQTRLPGPNGSGSPTAVLQTSPHAQTLSDGGGRPRETEGEKVAPS